MGISQEMNSSRISKSISDAHILKILIKYHYLFYTPEL